MALKKTPKDPKRYKPVEVDGGYHVSCPDCSAQRGGPTVGAAIAIMRGHMISQHGYSLSD